MKSIKRSRVIGILTLHDADNYGAVSQCYALQETLRRLCPQDEVLVVDYRCPAVERGRKLLGMRKPVKAMVAPFFHLPTLARRHRAFARFRRRFLHIGAANFSQYDLIVYGSDQIWNPAITGNDETYFGAGYGGKKIAYAASSGGELELTEHVLELLRAFSAISCREETLSGQLRGLLNVEALRSVCDPVFLLDKSEWLRLAKPPRERGYVLVYCSDPSLIEETQALARRFGKKVVEIVIFRGLRPFFKKERKLVAGISTEEFLGYIANADFVCTRCFHGVAFSILLEKDFYAFKTESGACRITDLLRKVGLEERYITRVPEKESLEAHAIDWESARQRVEAYREESMQYLGETIVSNGGGALVKTAA